MLPRYTIVRVVCMISPCERHALTYVLIVRAASPNPAHDIPILLQLKLNVRDYLRFCP